MKKLLFLTIIIMILISCKNVSIKKEELKKEEIKKEINIKKISIIPNWKATTIINLEKKNKRTIIRNGIPQSTSSVSDIELKLTKLKNNYWNGTWNIKVIRLPFVNNSIVKKIESLTKGFNYQFVLDSKGTFVELINWIDIQKKGLRALDIIISEIRNKPGINSQMIAQIKTGINEMFNTKEKIETFLIQDLQLFFSLSGLELTKDESIEGDSYIRHPLSGDQIKQKINITYKKAYSDSTCDIQLVQTIDKADLSRAVKNTLKKINNKKISDKTQRRMSNTNFDVNVINDFNISLKTGLVKKVVSIKTTIVGSFKRIDRLEIIKK